MTRKEAKEFLYSIADDLGFTDIEYRTCLDGEKMREAINILDQEPCEDCISRKAVLEMQTNYVEDIGATSFWQMRDDIRNLPSVIPQPKTGHWLRMSDLSEQEDDRYKCSRCGNVVHHTNKMNLYTFNSWCGRCGSDNGRKRGTA